MKMRQSIEKETDFFCPQCLRKAEVIEQPTKVFRYFDRTVWWDAYKKMRGKRKRRKKKKENEKEKEMEMEQEPFEWKKRHMSWCWHNESIASEFTVEESWEVQRIMFWIEDPEERKVLMERQMQVREWIKRNDEH
jgi:hypothetical protein